MKDSYIQSERGHSPPDDSKPLVSIRSLTLDYGDVRALDHLDLDIPVGAVGLLGPNGAGKSSLLRVLLGLVRPSGAEVRVAGMQPKSAHEWRALRRQVGYMPESDGLLPGMNAVEMVTALGQVGGLNRSDAMTRTHQVLDYVGIMDERYRDADRWSTGMKQRLKLAQALVHDPPVLLLDEATNGLDPKSRDWILDLLQDLSAAGKSILMCTHLLQDVEKVCEQVIMLQKGRVRWTGSLDELKSNEESWVVLDVQGAHTDLSESERAAFHAKLEGAGLRLRIVDSKTVQVQVPKDSDGAMQLDDLFALAGASGLHIHSAVPLRRTLEEAFLGVLDAGEVQPSE